MKVRRHFVAFLLTTAGGWVSLASAQSTGPDSAKTRAPRPHTCVKGLKEYEKTADIPQPFEILRPNVAPTAVDPSNFRAFMLGVFAEAGATGFVAQSRTTGLQQSFSAIPVFVPADSARVAAACRDSTPGATMVALSPGGQ
jgi:hypothetical protein